MISGLSSSSSIYGYSSLNSLTQKKEAKEGAGASSLLDALTGSQSTSSTDGSSTQSLDELFSSLDSNGDGSLSQDEFSSLGSKYSADMGSVLLSAQEDSTSDSSMLSSMDSDGDGLVSESEFTTAVSGSDDTLSDSDIAALFDSLDANGDGSIDDSEAAAASGGQMGAAPPPPPPPADDADDSTTTAAANSTDSTDSTDESSSTSSTSTASASGAGGVGGSRETYDPRDTNEDGVVSAEELAAARGGSGRLSSGVMGTLLQFNEVNSNSSQAVAA